MKIVQIQVDKVQLQKCFGGVTPNPIYLTASLFGAAILFCTGITRID